MQTSKSSRETNNAQTSRFSKRIGSTTYRVTMYFPDNESESLETKILRLIKNDLNYQSDSIIMGLLQTDWLPDGGSL